MSSLLTRRYLMVYKGYGGYQMNYNFDKAFGSIRSLLQRTSWDQKTIKMLHSKCSILAEENPRLWVTQVSPYVASFESKWDAMDIHARTKNDLRKMQALFPYAWFSYRPYTTQYPVRFLNTEPLFKRVRILNLRSSTDHVYTRNLEFVKHFPNLKQLGMNLTRHFSRASVKLNPSDVPTLEVLSLPNARLKDSDLEELTRLGFFRELRYLNLSGNESLTSIPYGHMPKLETLEFTGAGKEILDQVPEHVNLGVPRHP